MGLERFYKQTRNMNMKENASDWRVYVKRCRRNRELEEDLEKIAMVEKAIKMEMDEEDAIRSGNI